MFGFLIGLIILIVDIWAIAKAWSLTISSAAKLLWTLLILIFPVLGVILFLIFGGSTGKKAAA